MVTLKQGSSDTYVKWNQNSLKSVSNADGSVTFSPNGSDPYLEYTLKAGNYADKYITFYLKVKSSDAVAMNFLMKFLLFYKSDGTSIFSRIFVTSTSDQDYTNILCSIKMPHDFVGSPIIRIQQPNQTSALTIKQFAYWFGISSNIPSESNSQ